MTILNSITEAPPSHLHVEAVRIALEIVADYVKPKTLKRIIARLEHTAADFLPLGQNVVRLRERQYDIDEAQARILASAALTAIADMLS